MKNLFAAFFYSYFYFFSFGADKVKVLLLQTMGRPPWYRNWEAYSGLR